MTDKQLAGMPIDSGMDGQSILGAEAFWANLPTGRKWTSLTTHEKALVCHQMDRFEAALRQPTQTDALREALEAAPIISQWEGPAEFRARQDEWLQGKYKAALEASNG